MADEMTMADGSTMELGITDKSIAAGSKKRQKCTFGSLVDSPAHYQGKTLEAIDVIDDFELNFNLGNAVKYILRAGFKDNYVQDLKKAVWYIDHEIKRASKE